ncbi:MAG: NAD/NADP octopine/nopaline dehydrogenase family protein [Pseudomonadota bacterium]|nr:NAD/NADP octopine/nopaline dehydrogenase family protein [Pseudomonadota bacterium]
MEIAVMGGGHGCYAAASEAAEAGHNVRFWRRDVDGFRAVLEKGAITINDHRGRRDIPVALATTDVAEAMEGADLILSPLPATAQQGISEIMAPHLKDGMVVFIPPGSFGSYVMARNVRDSGNNADICFGEAGTLPWLVRKQKDGSTRITTRTARLPTGIFPASSSQHAFSIIKNVFPEAELRRDALDAALLNYGPIIHSPLILMNAGPLNHFEVWDIHNEGTQPVIRNVQDALDAERIAVRETLGYGSPHFPLSDHYNRKANGELMYSLTSHDKLVDSSDWREDIDLFTHRYMLEDIAFGLALLVSLGDWTGIPCPVAAGLLSIGGAAIGKNFRANGRTIESLKLQSTSVEKLQTLLHDGFND